MDTKRTTSRFGHSDERLTSEAIGEIAIRVDEGAGDRFIASLLLYETVEKGYRILTGTLPL